MSALVLDALVYWVKLIFCFGRNRFNADQYVVWNGQKVANPHFLVLGTSGSGKTTFINEFVYNLASNFSDFEFHVIDVHGDININSNVVQNFLFSETSKYGLNPFVLSSDVHYGGVRRKVKSFIHSLNRTTRKLGIRQENALTNILFDLYFANGFYLDDPDTWSINYDPRDNPKFTKKYPTLLDLKRYLEYRVKQLFLGTNSKTIAYLEELNKKVSLLNKNSIKYLRSREEEEREKIEKRIEELKDKLKELFINYLDSLQTGKEFDDVLKYDSYDVMKSLLVYIDELVNSGIFSGEYPVLSSDRRVAVYKIHAMRRDEQKLFVDFLLEDIFLKKRERGISSLDTYIVLDEAHLFATEDPDHILNVLLKEGRKFGVGVVIASQSLKHFSSDVLTNTASKVILGVNEVEFDLVERKLKTTKGQLRYLVPRKTMLVKFASIKSISSKYYTVDIDYSVNRNSVVLRHFLDV